MGALTSSPYPLLQWWSRLTTKNPRFIALAYASPYLVFFVLPFYAAIRFGVFTIAGGSIFLLTLALFVAHISSWLLLDLAPRTSEDGARFLLIIALLALIHTILTGVAGTFGGHGSGFLLTYVATPAVLLAPRKWLPQVAAFILSLSFLYFLLFPADGIWPLTVVGITATMVMVTRISIEAERRKSAETQQQIALSEERERSRISADLHDVLGHTLTGMSMKLDLTGRLLDAGETAQARAHIDELTEMARNAVSDIRDVVAANKTLFPHNEIESARTLCDAVGVELTVTHQGEPRAGFTSTLIAHAIREGVTNALRHARPTQMSITLGATGVRIINDGCPRGPSVSQTSNPTGKASAGTGLAGLRERIGAHGSVQWGMQGKNWVLEVEVERP
ncbi:MAG: histidine kinase [Actinomycetaceae bacterium]|nr:histidine kinase [Actinomycetaceae bacterium]